MNKLPPSFAPIFGLILLIAGGILYAFYGFVTTIPGAPYQKLNASSFESADPLISKVGSPRYTSPQLRADNFTLGPKDAPVKIFEFSDFSCPYCKTIAASLRSAIKKHPDIELVWKDFPVTSLHPSADEAHAAARCAGEQNKFWEYHDKLFEAQGAFSRETFLSIAEALSLQLSSFGACLDDKTTLQPIQADVEEGNDLGVDGTPYLFIGDQQISGLLTKEELEQVINFQKQLSQTTNKE